MSELGRHQRTWGRSTETSAFAPRTDIVSQSDHFRKVPQADYALAISDVVVKAALDIGATWS